MRTHRAQLNAATFLETPTVQEREATITYISIWSEAMPQS